MGAVAMLAAARAEQLGHALRWRHAPLGALLCAAALALSCATPAEAQQYPTRPVRLIVGLAAGGPTDLLARALAQDYATAFGQQFYVENRAGGNLVIATQAAARAAPDGYTLLFSENSALTMNPGAYKSLPYDPVNDFAPVSLLSWTNFVIVCTPGKFKAFSDFIDYAKANPGKLSYGTANLMTVLLMNQLKSDQGVDLLNVPFKGASEVVTNFLSGQIDIAVGPIGAYAPLVAAGKAHALVSFAPERNPQLTDTPTVKELGRPQLQGSAWMGVFAPAGTPQDIIDRLSAQAVKSVNAPELRGRIGQLGQEPAGGSSQVLGDLVKSDLAKWVPLVKAAGIKYD
jgi:tripartite-type tricarboxylate transporter receptor subunit TctC